MTGSVKLPADQQAICDKGLSRSGRFRAFIPQDVEQPVPQRFEQMVRASPERLAVQGPQYRFTYHQLNDTANRIAHTLLQKRGESTQPVVLLFDHDATIIAAMMGVLKAAKMYVPLDPRHPPARLAHILHDTQASLILTDESNAPFAQQLADEPCEVLNISQLEADVSTDNPALPIPLDTYAYLIYTSGSTGQPKGVIGYHRDLMHFTMIFTNDNHYGPDDRVGVLNSCSFSGPLAQIYPALLNGAALCFYDVMHQGIHGLADWLIKTAITQFNIVPALFRELLATLTDTETFPDLRAITLGGDRVYKSDVELYKQHFSPHCILRTGLGTSEVKSVRRFFIDHTTTLTTHYVPVGYAVDDIDVLVLDDDGTPVEPGEVGEIVVKSRYMSPGYWRKPELTRERFRPDPDGSEARLYYTGDLGCMLPDGCLMHLGRKDFQVKIRGHRVEIAEIEMALLDHPEVEAAVVVARDEQPDGPRLIGYIVPTRGAAPTVSSLRRALAATCPAYMIPATFVFLNAMPLTTFNKVDRRALPAPSHCRPALESPFVAPRTPIETKLAQLWASALGLDEVGIHDNFLDLGGHSLLATQIVTQTRHTLQAAVPVQALFDSPTVAEMATEIVQYLAKQAQGQDVERLLSQLEASALQEAAPPQPRECS